MDILIQVPLNRSQRLILIEKQIVEAELHGSGEIRIQVHNNQITDSFLTKHDRYGNTVPLQYEPS